MTQSGSIFDVTNPLKLPYKLNLLISIAAGMVSGFSTIITGYPLDNIRVRLQTIDDETGRSQYENAWDCFVKTIKYEGVLGLYKGASANVAGVVPTWTIMFFTYDMCMKYLYKKWPVEKPYYNAAHYAVSSMVAGAMMCIVMTPQELVRNLLAIQRNKKEKKYDGFFDCLAQIYKRHGIAGFYKGNTLTLLRDVPGSAFYYLGYEMVHDFFVLHQMPSPKWVELMSNAMGGVSAGFWFWIYALPFDTWKNRVQVLPDDVGDIQVLKDMIEQEGVLGLYRGILPTYVRGLPVNCMTFLSNHYAKKWLGLLALFCMNASQDQDETKANVNTSN